LRPTAGDPGEHPVRRALERWSRRVEPGNVVEPLRPAEKEAELLTDRDVLVVRDSSTPR
jgi:hypothetical protein